MGRIVWRIATAVGLFGLYLFLAGDVSLVEIVAGLICAGTGNGLALALDRVAKRHFGPPVRLRAVLRPLAALIPETLVVGRDLLVVALWGTEGQRGAFLLQPFDPGVDDRASATWRALSVLGVSLAPRTFVIRGERDTTLLLHGFPPKVPSPDAEWPA